MSVILEETLARNQERGLFRATFMTTPTCRCRCCSVFVYVLLVLLLTTAVVPCSCGAFTCVSLSVNPRIGWLVPVAAEWWYRSWRFCVRRFWETQRQRFWTIFCECDCLTLFVGLHAGPSKFGIELLVTRVFWIGLS